MCKRFIPWSLLERVAPRLRLIGGPARLEILNLLQARAETNVQDSSG